jgi:Skp family chaperone for outer membrane proteins
MSTEEEEDLDYLPKSKPMPAWFLPVLTSAAALGVGAMFGATIGYFLSPETVVEVPRDLSQEELQTVCAPVVLEKTNQLEEAQDKVQTLTTTVSEKAAKVKDLEAEMKQRSVRGAALVRELKLAKAELQDAIIALQVAQEEKNQLIDELKETVIQLEKTETELVEQKEKTEYAKEDALTNKWYRFINDAQLEICERGNRKKLGKCREAVAVLLGDPNIRDKFTHCVRSGQATPGAHVIEKKRELPEYAQWLNQEDKIVHDWYLLLCDPTLPEKEDGFLDEEHLPKSGTTWNDDFLFLEDLDDLPEN